MDVSGMISICIKIQTLLWGWWAHFSPVTEDLPCCSHISTCHSNHEENWNTLNHEITYPHKTHIGLFWLSSTNVRGGGNHGLNPTLCFYLCCTLYIAGIVLCYNAHSSCAGYFLAPWESLAWSGSTWWHRNALHSTEPLLEQKRAQ